MFKQIAHTAMNLPENITAICRIQFFCWIGWFPFLLYSTTWYDPLLTWICRLRLLIKPRIGEVYLRYNASPEARVHPDSLGQIGRIGSMALIAFSVVTFAGSVVFPWLIEAPKEESDSFTPRPPESIAHVLTEMEKYKPKLITAWSYAHIVFAGSMVMAPFVTSLRAATIIVGICGIPWALQCWAPFTFIGMEINKLNASNSSGNQPGRKTRDSMELDDREKFGLLESLEEHSSSSGDLSGAYLGILNLYTTLPQFIGTFISWVVFSILEPGKSPELAKEAHPDEHHSIDGPNAIAVCLFIGGLSAVLAAYATERFKRILQSGSTPAL